MPVDWKETAATSGKATETANGMIKRYGSNPVYGQIIEVIEQRARMALRQT